MNLYPTVMYYYTGKQDREGVYLRFADYFSAREAYRRIREILKVNDLPHCVLMAGTEAQSGEYQFDIFFDRGITRPEVREALEDSPPALIGG